MGIECAAYPFKIDMRIYTPTSLEAGRSARLKLSSKQQQPASSEQLSSSDCSPETSWSDVTSSKSWSGSTIPLMRHEVVVQDEDGEEVHPGLMVLIPHNAESDTVRSTLAGRQDAQTGSQKQVSQVQDKISLYLRSPHQNLDEKFFNHFLGTVSTLLIVYDNPHNANPYRLAFPSLAHDSLSLHQAMSALGSLHLAHTTPSGPDINLKEMALLRYSESVVTLRETLVQRPTPHLADLATVLLLTFFEMMDSDTNNWQTHLKGAKDIFEKLFSVETDRPAPSKQSKKSEAMRNFLISALGYLDVAAAASTAQPTQIPGNYWDTVGGGWQYNLGVPSLNAILEGRTPEDDHLGDIRQSWSTLMTIQSDVGLFATDIEKGLSDADHARRHQQIAGRLLTWRHLLPDIFSHLDDASTPSYNADSIEGASCVVCYEQATLIYFHQVSGTNNIDSAPFLSTTIDSILCTFQKYGRGVSQMGMLWALFIAGTETADLSRQEYVRGRMQNMLSFGLGNVKRALQLLELVWIRRRQGVGDVRWFAIGRELQWTLLLP